MARPQITDSRIREYCGLFGVYGRADASELAFLGIYAQQHRGQESAGICVSDGRGLRRHARLGLTTQVFDGEVLKSLKGRAAISHVRYSTTGSCSEINSQPLMVTSALGQMAVAHNGNLVNAAEHRNALEARGAIFQTSSDTEVILHLLASPEYANSADPLAAVMRDLRGAFSLLFIFPDRIEAARDRHGLRPLCIGRLPDGAFVFASETCALDMVDAEYIRDVAPGEIVTLSDTGLTTRMFVEASEVKPAHCIFEHVYFADPSSNVFGQNAHAFRVASGRQLAREAPADADFVIPVPNCARCAAIGFSDESGLPRGRGFTTSHYAGRSFIMPTQQERDLAVRMKLNVIREAVSGKRLVVVEDSVVRGTTTRGKMGALRKAGAKEIHLRVASPPIKYPCYFGIDFPDPSKLVAPNRTIEEIRDYLEVDSLAYLSHEGMLACAKEHAANYCTACFSGNYPIQVTTPLDKLALER
ncbi:MAG TPA: amidophosphoribosyltransferase [Phycisphaerae bacterium]|nr:amidophosphoribosyltransferase [Phycisphaerae bacterium]HRW55356.1 amidophosphoribosyltransferase [Phycisphaerae bacterium]